MPNCSTIKRKYHFIIIEKVLFFFLFNIKEPFFFSFITDARILVFMEKRKISCCSSGSCGLHKLSTHGYHAEPSCVLCASQVSSPR